MTTARKLAVATSSTLTVSESLDLSSSVSIPCPAAPHQLFWSTNKSYLFAASRLGIQRLSTKRSSWKSIIKTRSSDEQVSCFALRNDGDEVVYAVGGVIHFWNVSDSAPSREPIRATSSRITHILVSSDGHRIIAVTPESTIVFDLEKKARAVLRGSPKDVAIASLHPQRLNALYLATTDLLLVYDIEDLKKFPKRIALPSLRSPLAIAHSPFALNLVAVASPSGTLDIVDVDKDKDNVVFQMELSTNIATCDFVDGKTMVCGSEDGRLYEVNLKSVNAPLKHTVVDPNGGPVVAMSLQPRLNVIPRTSTSSDDIKEANQAGPSQRPSRPIRPVPDVDGAPLRPSSSLRTNVDPSRPRSRLLTKGETSRKLPEESDLPHAAPEPVATQRLPSRSKPSLHLPSSPQDLDRSQLPSPPPDPPQRKTVQQATLGVNTNQAPEKQQRSASGSHSSERPLQTSRRVASDTQQPSRQNGPVLGRGDKQPRELRDTKGKRVASERSPERDEDPPRGSLSPVVSSSGSRHSLRSPAVTRSPRESTDAVVKSPSPRPPPRFVSHEMAVQVSPLRRGYSSPTRPNHGRDTPALDAQEVFRSMVREVMYEVRQEERQDMINLHLDVVRAGRMWKNELRTIMHEHMDILRDLKEENARLRRENDLLRRGI